jgi:hypothetical protein
MLILYYSSLSHSPPPSLISIHRNYTYFLLSSLHSEKIYGPLLNIYCLNWICDIPFLLTNNRIFFILFHHNFIFSLSLSFLLLTLPQSFPSILIFLFTFLTIRILFHSLLYSFSLLLKPYPICSYLDSSYHSPLCI